MGVRRLQPKPVGAAVRRAASHGQGSADEGEAYYTHEQNQD